MAVAGPASMPGDEEQPRPASYQEPIDSHNPFAALDRLSNLEFGPAETFEELKDAYRLVYHSYLGRDYIEPNPAGMRFWVHNLLPETATFVAKLGGAVVSTVSLVVDSPLGLPMDKVYRHELSNLRTDGHRLGEVTMLADRRRRFARAVPVVVALFRLILDYARSLPLTELCITINPRHEGFYRKVLHFEELGELKRYQSVRDNPALAKYLSLARLDELIVSDSRFATWHEQAARVRRRPLEGRLELTPYHVRELLGYLTDPLPEAVREYLAGLYGTNCLP